jgi:hypothetical protein
MKSLKVYLAAAAVILILYITAQFNRPKAVDWHETLRGKDKIPFGTYILSKQLTDIFPGAHITTYHQPVYNVIAEDSIANTPYIIICPGIALSKTDYNQLVKYVKAGNDVFIAADYFSGPFEKDLHIETKNNVKLFNAFSKVNFLSPHLKTAKDIRIDKGVANTFFSKFDTLRAVVLSQDEDGEANFLRYTLGKGNLYLCANPEFFSNYSLLNHGADIYAATALSFIKPAKQIALDEYYTQGDLGENSPMRLFLSNPALQWAYYIALFSLLAFVLYEIKRRQRIIPVIEPLKNTSLEFVNVVGRVYYEKRDNANLAQKKVLYFLTWLRDEYQVKTNKLDDEFTEKIVGKLGISLQVANDLVNYIKYISVQQHVTDRELIELNKLIEQIYNQAS